MGRHQTIVGVNHKPRARCDWVNFVGKKPAGRDWSIENERHLFPPFVSPSENLFGCHPRRGLSHLFDFSHGAQGISPTRIFFPDQASDRLPVPGDLDRFSALDLVD
jgi:hypothetical protein